MCFRPYTPTSAFTFPVKSIINDYKRFNNGFSDLSCTTSFPQKVLAPKRVIMYNTKVTVTRRFEMEQKKRSGRPKKAEHEKVQYQRIAVYKDDYERLSKYIDEQGEQLTEAFTKMVKNYTRKT